MGQKFLSDNRGTFGKARPREGAGGFEEPRARVARATVLREARACVYCGATIAAGSIGLVLGEATWHERCADPLGSRDPGLRRARRGSGTSGPSVRQAPVSPPRQVVTPAPVASTAYVEHEVLGTPVPCSSCGRPLVSGTVVWRGVAEGARFRWHLACAPEGLERRRGVSNR